MAFSSYSISDFKPDKVLLTKNFTPGRRGKKIDRIIVHHNAGKLTTEQCYSVWKNRQASAHYQVEFNGSIGRLVNECNTAWHCGDFEMNLRSIGIEHANVSNRAPWSVSQATLDSGARLVALLCKKYNLGTPTWGINVLPHKKFMATQCPGELGDRQNKEYMQKCIFYYRKYCDSSTSSSSNVDTKKPNTIQVGDRVKVKSGAKVYGTNISFSPHVYKRVYTVRQLNNNRVVMVDGSVVIGAVDKKYLSKVG